MWLNKLKLRCKNQKTNWLMHKNHLVPKQNKYKNNCLQMLIWGTIKPMKGYKP